MKSAWYGERERVFVCFLQIYSIRDLARRRGEVSPECREEAKAETQTTVDRQVGKHFSHRVVPNPILRKASRKRIE